MINFKLKSIDDVLSVGTEDNPRMSWFWLTDAELWLKLGDFTIFEYTKEAQDYYDHKESPYNDYPLVRFIEDFTEMFDKIAESIPDHYYNLVQEINEFLSEAQCWLDKNDTDGEDFNNFYFDKYDKLIAWVYKRCLSSGHLIGGPFIYFFRNKDKITIVWETEHQLESGIRLWSASNGSIEIDYLSFVQKVNDFGTQFFTAMDKQVELALDKDWGNIEIDKIRLVDEHQERKADFDKRLKLLIEESDDKTNWVEVDRLYQEMKKEI